MQKYIIDQNDSINYNGTNVYRIVCSDDIINPNGKIMIHKGTKGGYISKDVFIASYNNNEDDTSWVYNDSIIIGNVRIQNASKVKDSIYINTSKEKMQISNSEMNNVNVLGKINIIYSNLNNIRSITGNNMIFDSDINGIYENVDVSIFKPSSIYICDTQIKLTGLMTNTFNHIKFKINCSKDYNKFSNLLLRFIDDTNNNIDRILLNCHTMQEICINSNYFNSLLKEIKNFYNN